VRTSDVAARYGGEELAIILPHTSLGSALVLGERVRSAVEHASFDDTDVRITASIGVACLQSLPDKTSAALMTAADTAVYAAKDAGRNCVHVGARPSTGAFSRTEMPTGRFRRPAP
jgi:diguanylate cyclase (GGDEF)-like protein